MELIKVPRLRLTLLQTLSESSISMCKGIAVLSKALRPVITVFASFKKAMVKDKTSAKEKQRLDFNRDEFLTGFHGAVKSELKFQYTDPVMIKVREELWNVVKKYGIGIKRLPFDEETAAIDNMLSDIAENDITSLASTGLLRWIPKIEKANKEYMEASSEFITDLTKAAATRAATLQAPELEDALEKFYATIFAQIIVSPSDELKKVYGELETLVDSMR